MKFNKENSTRKNTLSTELQSQSNARRRLTWKQLALVSVLILWISVAGYFFIQFASFVFSPIEDSPPPTPSSHSKKIVTGNLPLQELWRWSGVVGGRGDPPKIIIQDEFIVFAYGVAEKHISVFDARTGNEVWMSDDIRNLSSLDIDRDRIYVGTLKNVRAYQLGTGRQVWYALQQPPYKRGGLYVYSTDGKLEVYDVDLSGTPRNKRLYILNPQTGETLDIIDRPDIFFRSGTIYYETRWIGGSFSSHLTAKDEVGGDALWRLDFEGSPKRWPSVVDNIMYLDAGNIYAIDAETGNIHWQYDAVQPVTSPQTGIETIPENNYIPRVAYEDGMVYVVRSDATIVGLDGQTGQEVGQIEIDSPPNYFDSDGFFRDTFYTIAVSDEFVAVYYNDSQELIVFKRQDTAD